MSDLKPCPFCGGEGVMQEHVFFGYMSTYGVVCLGVSAVLFATSTAMLLRIINNYLEGGDR